MRSRRNPGRGPLLAATLGLCCAVLLGCSEGEGPGGDGPDCDARLLVDEELFRPVSVLQTPPRGRSLGTAPFVDCEGDLASGLGQTRVFRVPGQAAAKLIITSERGEEVVYINESVPWDTRPRLLKQADDYPTCSGPARFTGIWQYVEPEDMPKGEDYDAAEVPYTANFVTRDGTGVGLDRWAQVTLQAEVTAATRPVPGPALIERATAEDVPVTVTTLCEDGRFRVVTIRTEQ